MSELLNSIGLLSIRNTAILLFSVVRAKVLAVFLGPAGLGIVSQAINLQNFLWSTTAGGTNRGLTILVAHYVSQKDFARINSILLTTLLFLTITGVMVTVGCAVFANQISILAFGTHKYAHFVIIVAAASWFAIQTSLITAVFRGLLKIKAYTISSVLGYLLTISIIFVFIHFFGLTGAIISILAGQAINLLIGVVILRKYVLKPLPEIGLFREKPDWSSLNQILQFIGPLLILQFIMGVGNLILRGELIRRLGEGANGLYQVVWGISMTYMTLFNDTHHSYLLPKIASHLKNPSEVVQIQNVMMRIYLLLLSPFLIALLSLREFWIPILYSREFLVAGSLIIWQFCGDLFVALRISINAALIPQKRFAYLIFEEIFKWGSWMGVSLWLMPKFGLVSIPMGYFITNGILIIICLIYQYLVMDFRILIANLWLIAKLLPLIVVGLLSAEFISSIWLRLIVVALVIAVMYLWLPTPAERRRAYSWVNNLISKNDRSNSKSKPPT